MLLSIRSIVFSSSALTVGEAFFIVLTSWSLCFPELKENYHEWCIRDRYTHTCSRSKSTGSLRQDVLRSSFFLTLRSEAENSRLQLGAGYSHNLLSAVFRREFFHLVGTFLACQLFPPGRRVAEVQHTIWQQLRFSELELVFKVPQRSQRPRKCVRSISRRQCSRWRSVYIGRFFLLHFEGESFCSAVKAEVMAAGEHEDIFWEFFAFRAGLRLLHDINWKL